MVPFPTLGSFLICRTYQFSAKQWKKSSCRSLFFSLCSYFLSLHYPMNSSCHAIPTLTSQFRGFPECSTPVLWPGISLKVLKWSKHEVSFVIHFSGIALHCHQPSVLKTSASQTISIFGVSYTGQYLKQSACWLWDKFFRSVPPCWLLFVNIKHQPYQLPESFALGTPGFSLPYRSSHYFCSLALPVFMSFAKCGL